MSVQLRVAHRRIIRTFHTVAKASLATARLTVVVVPRVVAVATSNTARARVLVTLEVVEVLASGVCLVKIVAAVEVVRARVALQTSIAASRAEIAPGTRGVHVGGIAGVLAAASTRSKVTGEVGVRRV